MAASEAFPKVHGTEGGVHACAFCPQLYECFVDHVTAGEPMQPGGRCCTECRLSNLAMARRLRCA